MKVLLHVEDSDAWHPAARLVRPIVQNTEGTLTAFSAQWSRVKQKSAFDAARRVLDLPDAQFATRAHAGLAEYVIPDEARHRQYDLVTVGRFGALDRVTNGLVTGLVAHFTPANILVVRGPVRRVKRIACACAGGPRTPGVVDAAALLARAHGATLTILHVRSQLGLTAESAPAVDAATAGLTESDAPEARVLVAARDRARAAGVDTRIEVRAGLVLDEILEGLREGGHDVLVVGAHGGDIRERLLEEDIGALLVRSAPVPCLLVKRPGPPLAPPDEGR